MKTFIILLLFIAGIFVFFVPTEMKIELLGKAGKESSYLGELNEKEEEEKRIEEKKKKEEERIISLMFDQNKKAIYSGNINNGEIMEDLSWASLPYVKCFNSNEKEKFSGNIKLHRVLLGKKKTAVVSLITDENLSMFVYKTDPLSKIYPPEKEYVHDCKKYVGGVSEKILEMKGNTITSDIVIGVSGGSGVLEGSYSLEIEEK